MQFSHTELWSSGNGFLRPSLGSRCFHALLLSIGIRVLVASVTILDRHSSQAILHKWCYPVLTDGQHGVVGRGLYYCAFAGFSKILVVKLESLLC